MVVVNLPDKPYTLPYENRGTTAKPYPVDKNKEALQRQIAECRAKGGRWDGQKCVFSKFDQSVKKLGETVENTIGSVLGSPNNSAQQEATARANQKAQQDKIRTANAQANAEAEAKKQEETKVSDVTYQENPDGSVTVTGADGKPTTLTKEQYRDYLASEMQRGQSYDPQVIQAQQQPNVMQQQKQVKLQRLMQMAQEGLLTPQELQMIQGNDPDLVQAATAGAVGIIPGLIGGAVGGATIGAIGGAGAGAIPGAIIGGIGGATTSFILGVKSSLKGQQTEAFAGDKFALTKGTTYLNTLITDTNKNPQNAPENIALFYKTLNMIDAAHARTTRDAHEDLNKALGAGGFDNLAQFEIFDATLRDYYIRQFNLALEAPDPTKMILTAEEMGIETNENV